MALADWANGYIPIITRRHFFTKHPTHFLQQGFASENYFRVKRSNYGIFYKSVKNIPKISRSRRKCHFWLHWMVYCDAALATEKRRNIWIIAWSVWSVWSWPRYTANIIATDKLIHRNQVSKKRDFNRYLNSPVQPLLGASGKCQRKSKLRQVPRQAFSDASQVSLEQLKPPF